jgi:ankyrin repeat protein
MSDKLAKAIFLDDLKTVEELIDAGSIDINANLSIDRPTPPLIYAVEIARKAIVEALLRAGANIDSVNDGRRFTACHAAVMNSLDGLLPVLLAHRPNLALKDADGFTPLHLAIVHRRDRIAVMLIEAGAPVDLNRFVVKFIATYKNATQAVIKRGIDLRNVQYESGRTPLHAAASKSRDRDLLQMLATVCDLDALARPGGTCTHLAGVYRNAFALRCFITAGANVNAPYEHSRQTPLHMTVDRECMILLLAAGGDVHAKDAAGNTPCHEAARIGAMGIVHALVAAGADLDTRNREDISVHELLLSKPDWALELKQDAVDSARREIAKTRLDFVRHRALQVCFGLQSRGLDALQMCEVLLHSCGPLAPLILFHHWWKIATTVKHFH